jgi:hypothetical protein
VPTAAAGLLALFALYRMEGTSVCVPIWAGLLCLSAVLRFRLPDNPAIVWFSRVILLGCVIVTNLPRAVDRVNMFDTQTMTWFGELGAAELVLASWTRPARPEDSTRPLWLSGLVMLAASSTNDESLIVAIVPAYFLALLVALRWPPPAAPKQSGARIMPWRNGVAVCCALIGGWGISTLITVQKSALTAWGMQVLGEHISFESGSLSLDPKLSSTFGQRGSLTRALLIEGDGEFSHLRGAAYIDYDSGRWGPRLSVNLDQEPMSVELEPRGRGHSIRVTRLLRNHGIVFAPINALGIHFSDGSQVYRLRARGDMLGTADPAPSQYQIALADNPDFQGPLCVPPTADVRKRLLAVPSDIDPRVRTLGGRITRSIAAPRRRLDAIEQYLVTHHSYSLTVDIGKGDPVSNFLLQHKSAHCEYFASAAVILARIAGVPARYVIGYMAHERDGRNLTVVRQRDAHAWAECWVDGTGWVVLDATPGDGRPDALQDRPSIVTRLFERIEDLFTALKLGAHRGAILTVAAVAVGLFLLVTLLRALWTLAAGRRRAHAEVAYALTDAELAALFRDFERACRRRGLVRPPGSTWLEYLSAIAADGDAPGPAPSNVSSARAFVDCYNRARFGGQLPPEGIEGLRALLARFRAAGAGPDQGVAI